MKTLFILTKRNIKLFFKDKGVFFPSLITPIILLVLFVTFLADVYRDSFISAIPNGVELSEKVIDSVVGGQLVASLLAVCCITIAFCSNMIMVQDKVNGAYKDFLISPVKSSTLSLSYFLGTLFSTLIVCLTALIFGLGYIAISGGWCFTFTDILLITLDVILLTIFGTSISSLINSFLNTQGQMSAVGTIVSSGYGFICGAYMPIASFGIGLQKVLSFLPGTYGTALIKNHILQSSFTQLINEGVPSNIVEGIKEGLDCNLKFFNTNVSVFAMFTILISSTLLFIGIYILINKIKVKHK